MADTEDETLTGIVERITFRGENDWSVMQVRIARSKKTVAVVGYSVAQPGQRITALGAWKNHPSYGTQFSAKRITATHPNTPEGIIRYLSSGMIPGIGPATAKAIVAAFGIETIDILNNNPQALMEVRGIGPKKAEAIAKAWAEQRAVSDIMLFLHGQNIPPYLCRRIYRQYGDQSIEVIRTDPFRLALEVTGIGFKTADKIAAQCGIAKNSPQRIRAGLVYLMHETTTSGHCGTPRDELVAKAEEELAVERALIEQVLDAELSLPRQAAYLVEYDGIVYPAAIAACEERVAATLLGMIQKAVPWEIDAERAILEAEAALGFTLAPNQRKGVLTMLSHRVSILTGGPGTGKTATLNVLLHILKKHGVRVHLAAPTGKAAQRAAEVTGVAASTIHRLLGLKGPGSEPVELKSGVLVIDEMSMVDIYLMHSIAKAAGNVALVMVGDVDQLPSVGPGQVLADLIRSGVVPVTRLTEVFRQAAGSLIIRNAHRINRGLMPENGQSGDDFFFIPVADRDSEGQKIETAQVAERIKEIIVDLVADKLPNRFGFDPIEQVMVLSPMNITTTGVTNLNTVLQERLNPTPARAITRFGTRFGVGDKVIQTRNNYQLEIFNGDIGIIHDIDDEESVVAVDFAGRTVQIPFDELDALRLAYAISIHKSQGSQAEAVVIPVTTQHFTMLQRNLIYTAVTRAKRLVILVGQKRALAIAVKNDKAVRRITRLGDLLRAHREVETATKTTQFALHF
jgi:exodeoxyribonuclease V alpha subunit